MPRLKPFFSFYGSKWRAAPLYPSPRYNTICEPFAGSAAYSVLHHQKQVVLYDLDPVIAGVWHYLIHVTPAEIMGLPERLDHVDEIQGPQEARWLVGFWLSKATAFPRQVPSKWARSGHEAYQYWGPEIKDRIARQLQFIQHWQIVNDTCYAAQDQELTWFIDPPYQGAPGKHYVHKIEDYQGLADWCRQRPGQVICCEKTGADWLPFEHLAVIKGNSGAHGKGYSSEAVWIQ